MIWYDDQSCIARHAEMSSMTSRTSITRNPTTTVDISPKSIVNSVWRLRWKTMAELMMTRLEIVMCSYSPSATSKQHSGQMLGR